MTPSKHLPFPHTSAWRRTAVGALLAMTALLAVACGGSSKATSSSLPAAGSSKSTVAAASSSLGDMLVNSNGTTLYLFAKDSGGKSSCTGACAQNWPPYAPKGGAVHAGSGVTASLLHTIKRPDGRTQLVYNGHPLYTFGGDSKPGDMNGQASDAFGAKWYAVSPSGSAIEKAASSPGKGNGY
jgi:predicted lipoprotein with Yx(FWY)xxD motif